MRLPERNIDTRVLRDRCCCDRDKEEEARGSKWALDCIALRYRARLSDVVIPSKRVRLFLFFV